jgi:hypothetical protein
MEDYMADYPLDEILAEADRLIAQGAKVYQKFTCAGCGQRLTIEEPNVFYKSGTCDKCNVITTIKTCNYMVIWSDRGES